MPSKKDSATLSKTFLSSGEGVVRSTRGIKSERIFFIPDPHHDDHDVRAIDLAGQICEAFKPTRIIWLGDILDAGWASTKFRFDKARAAGQFAREVAAWEKSRELFRAPQVDIIPGNHDRRIVHDYRWDKPELQHWRGFDTQYIYCSNTKLNINYVKEAKIELAEGEFIATHGRYLGPTAPKREMERWGTSGVSAHTHRLVVTYQRDYRRGRVWASLGHLQNNPAAYQDLNDPAPQDWMNAVGLLCVEGNSFHLEPIPFTLSYSAMYAGKRYKA
jgi:hypothetical protein